MKFALAFALLFTFIVYGESRNIKVSASFGGGGNGGDKERDQIGKKN